MEAINGLLVFALTFASVSGELCSDLDTDACARLIQAKPDFCVSSPLANSACKRSCNNCPLTCYHCPQSPVKSPAQCTNTTICPVDKTCVISTLHARDGRVEHWMTCGDKMLCDGYGFGFHPVVGKRDRASRDLSLTCCHSDLCNVPGYTTSTAIPHQQPTTMMAIYSCHNDIVFVVDESGSIGPAAFHKAVSFITDLVRRLDIGVHATQIGLLVYDNLPHVEWYLNEYTSKADLLSALTYVPYHDGISRTDLALKFVRENMLQYKAGDRLSAKNVVVVITDGRSSTHAATVTEAQMLRTAGTLVVAIGMGSSVFHELTDIATDSNHVIKVIGSDHFPNAVPIVLPMIC